jgi:hypothetical protein
MQAKIGSSLFSSKYFLFSILVVLFLLLALFYGRPVIQNDGVSYYALTVSLLRDGDFDLTNQLQQISGIRLAKGKVPGRASSLYSCGFGLLYFPFIRLTQGLAALFPAIGTWRPYMQNFLFPFPHALGIFLGSLCFGLLSVCVGWSFAQQKGLSNGYAFFVAVAVFLGTPLAFYTFTAPSFIHASDTFLATAAFYLATIEKPLALGKIRFRYFLMGFFLAFSVVLRNNNIVMVPVIVGGVLYFERERGWKHALMICIETLLGALPMIIIQARFNLFQYGAIFTTGYSVSTMRDNPGRHLSFLFRIDKLFIHRGSGIFVWASVSILAFVGFILGWRERRREAILALILSMVVIVSIRFAGFVHGGGSFGQRYLCHLYICWIAGLIPVFLRWKKKAAIAVVPLSLWVFLMQNIYFINDASPGGREVLTRNLGIHSPKEMLRSAWEDWQISRTEGRDENLVGFWYRSLGSKPYPTLIHTLNAGDVMRKGFKKSKRPRRIR